MPHESKLYSACNILSTRSCKLARLPIRKLPLFSYLFLILLVLYSLPSQGQSLDSSAYPVLWLRADRGGFTDSSWTDFACNGHYGLFLADNYMPIISMNDKIGEMSELKHFTWQDIDDFSSVDRRMISYRQGGSGDWKAKGKPGDGYLMVTIDGQPYWADAIGQIPFALDYFTDRLEKHGDVKKAITETIQKGREYGEGKVFGGKTDNSNAYDIYFVLRGALYGSHKYESTKKGLKTATPAADPKTLGGRIWYRDAIPYLGLRPKK